MPAGPSVKHFAVRTLTSRVCGHAFEATVLPKSSGRQAEDIAFFESRPCVPCLAAASAASWEQVKAEAAARGFVRCDDRWRHACGAYHNSDDPPAACRNCG